MERRKLGVVTPLTASGRSPLPEMRYGEEFEDNERVATTSLIQQCIEATAEAVQGQRDLITEQREVEKDAPKLTIVTRSDWIKFTALYKAYQFKKGTYSIVRQIDQEHHDSFICHISSPEFLCLDNDEISKCFDKHFAVITASGYEEVSKALCMPVSRVLCRSAIDIYSQEFLATIQHNSNISTCFSRLQSNCDSISEIGIPEGESGVDISTMNNNISSITSHNLVDNITIQSQSFSEFSSVPEVFQTFGPEIGKNLYEEVNEEGDEEEVIFVDAEANEEAELDDASDEFLYNAVLCFASTDSPDVSWDTDSELSDFEFDFDLADFGVETSAEHTDSITVVHLGLMVAGATDVVTDTSVPVDPLDGKETARVMRAVSLIQSVFRGRRGRVKMKVLEAGWEATLSRVVLIEGQLDMAREERDRSSRTEQQQDMTRAAQTVSQDTGASLGGTEHRLQ